MDFIDASENRINITSDNVIEIISLDENENGNSRQESDLFFFPESDFYGTIISRLHHHQPRAISPRIAVLTRIGRFGFNRPTANRK